MGSNLALQAAEKGINVVGKARGTKPELTQQGIKVVSEYKDFADFLESPRAIFLSLPAGSTIDVVIKRSSAFHQQRRRDNGRGQLLL